MTPCQLTGVPMKSRSGYGDPSMFPKDDWKWVEYKKSGRKFIEGSGVAASCLKGAPEPSRDIVISRVLPECCPGDIRGHLDDLGVEPCDIWVMSKEESKYKSFKFKLKKSYMTKSSWTSAVWEKASSSSDGSLVFAGMHYDKMYMVDNYNYWGG